MKKIVERPRRWVTAAVWAPVLPVLAWALLRRSGWEPGFWWTQWVAFTPYVAGAALLVVPGALLLRRWPAALVAVVAAATLLHAVLPRALPDRNPAAHGQVLRVLTANLLVGSVPPRAVVDLVRRLRIDVLAVQELTPEAAVGLHAAGLPALLPQSLTHPLPGSRGSGIYARFPLREATPIELGGFRQEQATAELPGGRVARIVSVHPCAPVRPGMRACWADGLRALPAADGQARILAGDFNATLDHAGLRRLLATGYRDAADVTGEGLLTTWPYRGRRARTVPPVTLDHVLADRGIALHGFRTFALPRSDHRAVLAQLTLP
ncbi:endonuclease/exonuclease/phosphatase family protein [Actinomadura scrupuli]|uniref:endonuclease/exonuclease/phosphatase family protein n=1 Tax=Actinomadura scrupuli TaxID=559629 RepID=UPI003D96E452